MYCTSVPHPYVYHKCQLPNHTTFSLHAFIDLPHPGQEVKPQSRRTFLTVSQLSVWERDVMEKSHLVMCPERMRHGTRREQKLATMMSTKP